MKEKTNSQKNKIIINRNVAFVLGRNIMNLISQINIIEIVIPLIFHNETFIFHIKAIHNITALRTLCLLKHSLVRTLLTKFGLSAG